MYPKRQKLEDLVIHHTTKYERIKTANLFFHIKIIPIVCIIFILFFYNPLNADDNNNLILNFYKNHISVVDGNRCSMYPSCSNYASQSFKKHGMIMGWIMSCDRLVRCGRDEAGIAQQIIVKNDQLIYDPVEANDFWWFNKDIKK
jgi:putative component of membrane protein insertase Oxa1/YidC/SpoIIIJ protein YidD